MKRLSPRDKIHTVVVNSSLPCKSRVDIGPTARLRTGDILKQLSSGTKVLLLSQRSLPENWLCDLRDSLRKEGFSIIEKQLADGEEAKSHEQLLLLWELLMKEAFTRKDCIIAIGGGALSDLAGFTASTYLRGIKLVLLPSTLLAQVDASIGGKTAINLPSGKNLAGSFYFPDAVIVDPDLLKTLPEPEIRSGMGEIVKYAFIENTIADNSDYKCGPVSLIAAIKDNFAASSGVLENPFLPTLISICIRMKLAVVLKDPFEEKLRRCLNLGHTLAHGLEKVSEFRLSHGEAVSIGTVFAFRFAESQGCINAGESQKLLDLLALFELPSQIPGNLDRDELAETVAYDKKREKDTIRFVMPERRAGIVNLDTEIDLSELIAFIKAYP